jgi:hypothetical protein
MSSKTRGKRGSGKDDSAAVSSPSPAEKKQKQQTGEGKKGEQQTHKTRGSDMEGRKQDWE